MYIKNGQKIWTDTSPVITYNDKYIKTRWISLSTRKMWMKTTTEYQYISIRKAEIRKADYAKYWGSYRVNAALGSLLMGNMKW